MFNNTIKFCAFILPIAVILFLFPLGKGSEIAEYFGMIVAWTTLLPILIIFSWDLAGCIIYIWKNRKNWREWLRYLNKVGNRILLASFLFALISWSIYYLTKDLS